MNIYETCHSDIKKYYRTRKSLIAFLIRYNRDFCKDNIEREVKSLLSRQPKLIAGYKVTKVKLND